MISLLGDSDVLLGGLKMLLTPLVKSLIMLEIIPPSSVVLLDGGSVG